MENKDLLKLLVLLKKYRVTHYKDKDIELKLDFEDSEDKRSGHPTFRNSKKTDQADQLISMIPKEDDMSEDDFLYYSSGYDPKENKLAEPSPTPNKE